MYVELWLDLCVQMHRFLRDRDLLRRRGDTFLVRCGRFVKKRGLILHKTFTKPSQNLHRAFAKPSQILHKTITEPSQILHKTFTKPPQNLHKPFTKPSQIPHKTFTNAGAKTAKPQSGACRVQCCDFCVPRFCSLDDISIFM